MFDDKLEELLRLQQTSSIAHYLEQFEGLLNEVNHQSEESLISFFIDGLKPELRGELKVGRPPTLRQAFSKAKLYEAQWGFNRFGGKTSGNREPLIKQSPSTTTPVPVVHRTLTMEERQEHTAKGLCFNCDDSYSPRHKSKGRLFRMDAKTNCLVEMLEEAGITREADDTINAVPLATEISLHAFSGTFNLCMIPVTGLVDGKPLTMLVDSGSTHNFIQDYVV